MELEADGIGGEGPAGQPRPFDRALALFDPLLRRAALISASTSAAIPVKLTASFNSR
jgi:hypothetical protein